MKEPKFIIFSCGRNCSPFVEKHISSVQSQTYGNFRHILVDDASTDTTYTQALALADRRAFIWQNGTNQRWLYNSVHYLTPNIIDDEEIVVILDMDDWFPNNNVLSEVADTYLKKDCWVTYSKVQRSHLTQPDPYGPYPENVIRKRNFRRYGWRFHSLKTFKAFLWKAIDYKDFLDRDGNFKRYSWDLALGFPILEMTPPTKLVFIPKVLYIYNTANPLSVINQDRKVKLSRQFDEQFFRRKLPYNILKRQ